MDLADPDLFAFRAAMTEGDVVVNASGIEDPALAAVAGERGCAFVDISATASYIAALRRLPATSPIVVDVGLAPGLTNLLAHALHREVPGPIDLAVVLGAGEHHGKAATEWSYRLLGKHFENGGERIRNYTRSEKFYLPERGKPRRLYRLDFSDQHTLSAEFGVPVRTFFALDSRLATAALATLTWIPGAAKAPRGLSLPGTEDWIVLARGRAGVTYWARGRNQSHTTALVATAAAARARELPGGVHVLHHLLGIYDLSADGLRFGRELHDSNQ